MKRFLGITILVLLIAAWIATEWVLYRRTVPPANVTDVDSFLRWQPDTERFTILAGENQHLMATGSVSGLMPTPSGSSAYVFDHSGKLVDWSHDIGDDPEFDERWQAQDSLGNGKSVSRAEVSSWLASAARTDNQTRAEVPSLKTNQP